MEPSARPSAIERCAYRAFGVRLDDRWRAWIREDLDDPGWARRQRLWSMATFAAFALVIVVASVQVTDRVPWAGSGGLIGALAFLDRRRRQIERIQLGPSRNRLTEGLTFTERLTMTVAGSILLLACLAAGLSAIEGDDDPSCRPVSSLAENVIAAAARPGVGFGHGASITLEPRATELVVRQVSLLGAPPSTGRWIARQDGELLAWDETAIAATESIMAPASFSVAADIDISEVP